jgi:hypothetical protein
LETEKWEDWKGKNATLSVLVEKLGICLHFNGYALGLPLSFEFVETADQMLFIDNNRSPSLEVPIAFRTFKVARS